MAEEEGEGGDGGLPEERYVRLCMTDEPEGQDGYGLADVGGKGESPWAYPILSQTFVGDGDQGVDESAEEGEADFREG